MKISGFTIARNVRKYNYPVIPSILSIIDICDEFIINIGDSEDDTKDLIRSIKNDKIRILENKWDMTMREQVLSHQTNIALQACQGDWAFYLQLDEVVHEKDLSHLKHLMQQHLNDPAVDALRFRWWHFYGSYYRYRVDQGWYQKQDRVIRNNGTIESCGDAYGFRRVDGEPLKRLKTRAYIYHYGWVQPGTVMAQRRLNAEQIGFVKLQDKERKNDFDFGSLSRFPIYFGSHPAVMQNTVLSHAPSLRDKKDIDRHYWWHPLHILKLRYKTMGRVKHRIE